MSIAPKRRSKAGVTATLVAEESTNASGFLQDHDYDHHFREYNVWINRRRAGQESRVEPGDRVTIGPRTIRKVFPLSATRPRVVRPGPDEGIGALLRQWVEEGDPEEDRLAFEEFKKAINETRAREGRPPVYP